MAVSSEHAYEAGCLGLQEFRGSGVWGFSLRFRVEGLG